MNRLLGTKTGIETLLEGHLSLPASVGSLAHSYRTASPFPHLILDDLFSDELLGKLAGEIPEASSDNWVVHEEPQLLKFNLRSVVSLGETGMQITAFLHSAVFLYFLSELTGIWNLLPDPYLRAAGYHVLPPGGHFGIHIDRNTDHTNGLKRRLALIIYLNRSWKHEFGGQLELGNSTGTHCEVIVEPRFNRTVLFEIADRNFHGVPAPVAAPDGETRKSFFIYYHTARFDDKRDALPHTTVYAPMFQNRGGSRLRSLIRDVTPPIVLRAVKALRRLND